MIRIAKRAELPDVLAQAGKRKRTGLCSAYSRNPDAYRHGEKSFAFDAAIYGHASVKQALIEDQHDKCAFCESKISHVAYGDVEHFRPKAAVRPAAGLPLTRPGYYWLAYDWENLLLSCSICNQRFKGNLFPLVDEAKRAADHHGNLGAEMPLFLHPAKDAVEMLISFRREIAFGKDAARRGSSTIDALGLNREELAERRRERYKEYEVLFNVVQLAAASPEDGKLADLAQKAKEILDCARLDEAEYAGMTRAAVADGFGLPA